VVFLLLVQSLKLLIISLQACQLFWDQLLLEQPLVSLHFLCFVKVLLSPSFSSVLSFLLEYHVLPLSVIGPASPFATQ